MSSFILKVVQKQLKNGDFEKVFPQLIQNDNLFVEATII
jgi:hypothetical protein